MNNETEVVILSFHPEVKIAEKNSLYLNYEIYVGDLMFIFFLKGGDNLNVLTESKEIFCIFHQNFLVLPVRPFVGPFLCLSVRLFLCHTSG